MYNLALIIFVFSEKKAFEHFPIGRKIITVQQHKITHSRGNTTSHISEEFMCCMGMEYVMDTENINKRTNHNII
jgi:hypothetical protein